MKILEGITVVEWTVFHVGPSAGVKLAEMGAEVIKLEEPKLGDQCRGQQSVWKTDLTLPSGRNWAFEAVNYGKKSVAINMRSERGREAAYRLIEKADVFLTNFRADAATRLGLDYETLRGLNPKLIYACSSSIGTRGPQGERPGLEMTVQAGSGLMFVTGEGDSPPQMIYSTITDQTGSLMLTLGILAALLARERLGIGQKVITSQLGGCMLLQIINIMGNILTGQEIKRQVRTEVANPTCNYYKCRDGRWIMLALMQDRYWASFCRAIERPDWEDDRRFDTMEKRIENNRELISLLDELFASQPYKHWGSRLQEEDLIFSVVNTTSDLLDDPEVLANNYLPTVEHPVLGKTRWLLTPVEFTQTPLAFYGPAPELGEHTEEVLVNMCGYSWEEICQLREAGALL